MSKKKEINKIGTCYFFVFLNYEFSDMKSIVFSFLILFFISCTEDKSIPNKPFSSDNKLVIRYQGYYERYFELPDKVEAYNDITINQIVEQVSPTEDIDLLQIVARSTDSDKYISFTVLSNSVGNDMLYNNEFAFRTSGGATYFPSNLNFEVLTNNSTEFAAEFSGELKHYNQYEDVYIYLDIRSASVEIMY